MKRRIGSLTVDELMAWCERRSFKSCQDCPFKVETSVCSLDLYTETLIEIPDEVEE